MAGVGTGGTITGVGEYLKAQKPEVKVVAVGPSDSPVLSKGMSARIRFRESARLCTAGAEYEIYDEDCHSHSRRILLQQRNFLHRKKGFWWEFLAAGPLHTAIQLAKRPENEGKTIVALLPDSRRPLLFHSIV